MGKSRLDLSALDLKLLAMAAMLVDHMGYLLFPTAMWMRYVGRLAFPIFAFQIAEGWYRTHDREKYTLRLLICAVVSATDSPRSASASLVTCIALGSNAPITQSSTKEHGQLREHQHSLRMSHRYTPRRFAHRKIVCCAIRG